jgi:hypothetical protein
VRLAAAIAVLAVPLSAAVYVHQRHTSETYTSTAKAINIPGFIPDTPQTGTDTVTTAELHPSWEDPAAVFIALGGLALAVAVGPRVKRS